MTSKTSRNSNSRKSKTTRNRPRFGVILLPYSVSYQTIANAALHAEKLGFDSLWISDHVQRGSTPVLECWTTISALSALTSKIRIGSLATCNSFRNPVLLAKMVGTVSQVSKDRLDLALGVGYDKTEHEAASFQFPKFAQRVEQLGETLAIIRSLWTGSTTSFEGKYWKLHGAVCEPKPDTRKLHVWIAGRNDSLLKLASAMAYGVNILPYSGVLDKRKISTFEEIEEITEKASTLGVKHLSMYCGDGGTIIGRNESDYLRRVRIEAKSQGVSEKDLQDRLENLSILRGTKEDARRSLEKLVSIGFEELMMIFPGWQHNDYTNMDQFAKEFLS